MKVLHVIGGELNGGAAKGVLLLHKGLLEKGINSRVISQFEHREDYQIFSFSYNNKSKFQRELYKYSDKFLDSLFKPVHPLSNGRFGFDLTKNENYKWADIIHLHWINNGTINIKKIGKIDKPVFWTIRDMWSFTGGCHYAFDCLKYTEGCNKCPLVTKNSWINITNCNNKLKSRIYKSVNLRLVSLSNWIRECAKQSNLLNSIENKVIPNPVDTTHFYPVDKFTARHILNLPEKSKIILVGSVKNDRYKGWKEFESSLDKVSKDTMIVTFGKEIKLASRSDKLIKNMGYLFDEVSLRLLYSSADVFVAPSIQEAFGKTVTESLACGTPVVAFNNSGPKDIIDHLENGYLANIEDPNDLANGINYILSKDNNIFLNKCLEKIESTFTLTKVSNQYINYYNSCLSE